MTQRPTEAQQRAQLDRELKRLAEQLAEMARLCQELRKGLL